MEATWIPGRLLIGEKPGGNFVFLWIIPNVDGQGVSSGAPLGSQASFSSLLRKAPLSHPGPRTHTHTLSLKPLPELQTLPSLCVLTIISLVTGTKMELLELPLNLAFSLSPQALGMAPQGLQEAH